jgi:hypothetical protein
LALRSLEGATVRGRVIKLGSHSEQGSRSFETKNFLKMYGYAFSRPLKPSGLELIIID